MNQNNETKMVKEDVFSINDKASIKVINDRLLKNGPTGTRITISDYDTGEVLGEYHNKILISASQFTACKLFGLDPVVNFPSYNKEFGLEHTLNDSVQPMNDPIVCLFAVGNDGCGTAPSDVYPVRFTERIEPEHMLPFRYVDEEHDLNDDLRKVYFGRYKDDGGMIRYMFKSFDAEPQIHLRYLDGTQITEDMYTIDSSQASECYVETRLLINRIDFRDYFEKVLGWDNAAISSISLLYAWYDNTVDSFLHFQNVLPFSKLNIPIEFLCDLSKSICVNYQLFF